MNRLTGIVLAGGQSARMGQNKAFIFFLGKRLVEHSTGLLSGLCQQVLISSNDPEGFEEFPCQVIPDHYPHLGPIGGLHACLRESDHDHHLVLSCDMPFINMGLLYRLLYGARKGYSMVAFSHLGRPEPLCAYYSKKSLPLIETQIRKGVLKMAELLQAGEAKQIELSHRHLLLNLNYPSDLENAHTLFRWKIPSMILIAGDGRHVGKSELASRIIRHFTPSNPVTAIKTTPHAHTTSNTTEILIKTDRFLIARERASQGKDSYRMLEAGAKEAFLVSARQEYIIEAFGSLLPYLTNRLMVAESGALAQHVNPGVFFFVKDHEGPPGKTQYLPYQPVTVVNRQGTMDFDVQRLEFRNNHIIINEPNHEGI